MHDIFGNPIGISFELLYALMAVRLAFEAHTQLITIAVNFLRRHARK